MSDWLAIGWEPAPPLQRVIRDFVEEGEPVVPLDVTLHGLEFLERFCPEPK